MLNKAHLTRMFNDSYVAAAISTRNRTARGQPSIASVRGMAAIPARQGGQLHVMPHPDRQMLTEAFLGNLYPLA